MVYVWKTTSNGFKWLNDPEKRTEEWILKHDEKKRKKGKLLEVDLEYPKKVHNDHSELPFWPLKDKKPSTKTKYLKVIQKARKKNEEFLSKATEKLETTLYDKEKYVI